MNEEKNLEKKSQEVENPVENPAEAPAEPAAEAPADGPSYEAVTVIVVNADEEQGALQCQSVKQLLRGADADIHLLSGANLCDTLVQTLLEHLPHVETTRLVLLTEGMFLLHPVSIYDIGVLKARHIGVNDADGYPLWSYQTHMPVLMHTDLLRQVLEELMDGKPYADVTDAYFDAVTPREQLPLIVVQRGDDRRQWSKEDWLLPVVSENPNPDVLQQWARHQRFMWVSPQSWTPQVHAFVTHLFTA